MIMFDGRRGMVLGIEHTVKIGLATLEDVADSTTDDTEADASEAAPLTSSMMSALVATAARSTAEAMVWKRIVSGRLPAQRWKRCQAEKKKEFKGRRRVGRKIGVIWESWA